MDQDVTSREPTPTLPTTTSFPVPPVLSTDGPPALARSGAIGSNALTMCRVACSKLKVGALTCPSCLGGRDVAQLGQGERPPVNYEYGMLTAKQRQQLVESAPV
jgi:hypothetical protein